MVGPSTFPPFGAAGRDYDTFQVSERLHHSKSAEYSSFDLKLARVWRLRGPGPRIVSADCELKTLAVAPIQGDSVNLPGFKG